MKKNALEEICSLELIEKPLEDVLYFMFFLEFVACLVVFVKVFLFFFLEEY